MVQPNVRQNQRPETNPCQKKVFLQFKISKTQEMPDVDLEPVQNERFCPKDLLPRQQSDELLAPDNLDPNFRVYGFNFSLLQPIGPLPICDTWEEF